MREAFEFPNQAQGVGLEPAAEAVLFIPRHRHGQAKRADISPAAFDFVRQPQRFNIQINFAIE
jgi:hypothetical protein